MQWTSDKSRFFAPIFAPPLMAAILWTAWSTDIVRRLENVTVDWRFSTRAAEDPSPDPRIALIGIGDQSLDEIGRWQDWSREVHARFLDALLLRPPEVVAFDLFFPDPSRDPEEDENFSFSLAGHISAITGMYLDTSKESQERVKRKPFPPISLFATRPFASVEGDPSKLMSGPTAETPVEIIAQSAWTGSVNFPPSRLDGIRREAPLIIRIGEDVYPSLVLQIVMRMEEASSDEVRIRIGDSIEVPRKEGGLRTLPIDERGMHYLNYRDTGRFTIFDYANAIAHLAEFERSQSWPEELPPLEDQVIIIGQSAEGLSDLGPTPYDSNQPLFLVQATLLDSILREDYLHRIPKPTALIAWLAIAWTTVFALRRAPFSVAITVPLLITSGFVALGFFVFSRYSILIPLALPVAGFLLMHTTIIGDRLASEFQKNQYIRGVFGSYVSPEVVGRIIDTGETPELGGEKVDITILFSDIQGFSTFSEKLEPEELVELMVEYLSALTDILTDRGGCLDKYIGDAIDAMFGAPVAMEDHAYVGVISAIEMQRKQAALRELWRKQGRPELVRNMRTRIGLNTGPAVVGNMGSRRRFNYTMMGDNVNLGARCESGAKSYGVYTMITEATCLAAEKTKDDIVYRYLDQIVVKGRTLPVKVYEVIETRENVAEETFQCLERYARGFASYLAMEWDEAIDFFEESSKLEPFQPERDSGVSTNPSRVMIARCRHLKLEPPGEDWDGVYRMTEK